MSASVNVGDEQRRPISYALRCRYCGWVTLSEAWPNICEACGQARDVGAAAYVTATEVTRLLEEVSSERTERVRAHAAAHGLLVWQVTQYRYSVLRLSSVNAVSYAPAGLTEQSYRSYQRVEHLFGPAPYLDAMKYLRDNSPELPAHLGRE